MNNMWKLPGESHASDFPKNRIWNDTHCAAKIFSAKSHVVTAAASLDDCTAGAGLGVFGQPFVRLLGEGIWWYMVVLLVKVPST